MSFIDTKMSLGVYSTLYHPSPRLTTKLVEIPKIVFNNMAGKQCDNDSFRKDKGESQMTTWKVMVYMAGENRLADDMVYALKEMKSVGSDDNLTILAEYSAKWIEATQGSQTVLPTPLRFYLINDDDHPRQWVVKNYVRPGGSTMEPSSYIDELANFIVWGVTHCHRESDRYMVVLSGDGGGPVTTFLPSANSPGKALKAKDLEKVLERARDQLGSEFKIDILGLDSCLMSMAEVAYEARDYASYLVSSQGNESDMGWPFRDILEKVREYHGEGPVDLAKMVVDVYNTYYVDYAMIAKTSACLSAIDLSGIDGLVEAVSGFTDAANTILEGSGESEPGYCRPYELTPAQQAFCKLLVRAHWVAQTFQQDQYADLYDFCAVITKEAECLTIDDLDLGPFLEACCAIMEVLSTSEACGEQTEDLVIKSCNVGAGYQYSRGLSVYFPWHGINDEYLPYLDDPEGRDGEEYDNDSFALVTGWGEFLRRYLCATRRPMVPAHPAEEFELFLRDPPDGKGTGLRIESTKNAPTTWDIANCVFEPLQNS